MKKVLILVALLAVFTMAGVLWRELGQPPADNRQAPGPGGIEAQLIEGFTITAARVNEAAPFMVDDQTRLDGARVGPGARITYSYTLTGFSSQEIDAGSISPEVMTALTSSTCSNEEIRPSLSHGGIYIYEYYGKDNVQIGSFEIDKQVCGIQ
mgnify:CR=1 FL=1